MASQRGAFAAKGSITAGSSYSSVTMQMETENKTLVKLSEPVFTIEDGQIDIHPSPIEPGQKKVMKTRKTDYSTFGTFGVVSWEIAEISRRVVVMWSVPFTHLINDPNKLAVGITKQNAEHDKTWPNLMLDGSSNEQLGFQMQKYDEDNTPTVKWIDQGFKISGIMTAGYNAEVKVWVEQVP